MSPYVFLCCCDIYKRSVFSVKGFKGCSWFEPISAILTFWSVDFFRDIHSTYCPIILPTSPKHTVFGPRTEL